MRIFRVAARRAGSSKWVMYRKVTEYGLKKMPETVFKKNRFVYAVIYEVSKYGKEPKMVGYWNRQKGFFAV